MNFEWAVTHYVFPLLNTLYYSLQLSFVTRIIPLVLVTLPSPVT